MTSLLFDRFVAAINSHDVETLVALMAPGHVFVDSLGNWIEGVVTMRTGWRDRVYASEDAGGLAGCDPRRPGDRMAGVRGQQAGLRDIVAAEIA